MERESFYFLNPSRVAGILYERIFGWNRDGIKNAVLIINRMMIKLLVYFSGGFC